MSGRGVRHGEELNPVLKEATWILPSVDHEPLQAAASRLAPQSQQRLSLRYVEADVEHLRHPQVKQPGRDDAAVPGTGEAERRAVNTPRVHKWTMGNFSVWISWHVFVMDVLSTRVSARPSSYSWTNVCSLPSPEELMIDANVTLTIRAGYQPGNMQQRTPWSPKNLFPIGCDTKISNTKLASTVIINLSI